MSEQEPGAGRARATVLGRGLARSLGVRDPDAVDFERWHDYVPLGDYALVYWPDRDMLSVRSFDVQLRLDLATTADSVDIRHAVEGQNDPTIGGQFERGGGYFVLDLPRDRGYFVRDFPVAATSTGQLRDGFEYHANIGATWRLRWGSRVAGIVHHFDDAQPVTAPVVWDDTHGYLGESPTFARLTGRARADALVGAYLAHRDVPRPALDREGRYDGGDYWIRYDAAADAIEAGAFVATPADLARLAAAGVDASRLTTEANVLLQRGLLTAPPAEPYGARRPTGRALDAVPGTAAGAHLAVLPAPAGAPGAPPVRLAYLVQRWLPATLTPLAFDQAMEQLLDYGTVWRHRWLWRTARIALGREPAPRAPVQRTPGDYGLDPAAERLAAPAPRTPGPADSPGHHTPGRPVGHG